MVTRTAMCRDSLTSGNEAALSEEDFNGLGAFSLVDGSGTRSDNSYVAAMLMMKAGLRLWENVAVARIVVTQLRMRLPG